MDDANMHGHNLLIHNAFRDAGHAVSQPEFHVLHCKLNTQRMLLWQAVQGKIPCCLPQRYELIRGKMRQAVCSQHNLNFRKTDIDARSLEA